MRFADAVVPAEWATGELAHAEFHGGRTETGPMTWAQQVMWRAAALSKTQHLFLNLRRVLPVPRRAVADVSSVVHAIGLLVSRHGALRTRVREIDAAACQETAAAGQLPVLLVDGAGDGSGDGSEAARELIRTLGDAAFDHGREWPVRFALVVVDGRVRQIVVVFSHSTVDAYAVDVVLRDLRLILLRGELRTPAGWQSMDVARQQHGPDQWRSRRAVRYWTRQYARLSGTPLDEIGPELAPRLRRGVLVSSAVAISARMIAARHGVTVSTVLLAATTALAAGPAGRDLCGLFNMSHNRFRPEYATAVANLGQIGFCVLDVSDRPSFFALLPRIYQVALDGYLHAYYDTAAMRRSFEEIGHDYATAFLPYYYFNDVRLPGGNALDDAVNVPESAVRAATVGSTFRWTDGLDRSSWHLLTHVVDEPDAVGLTLSVDTRFRTPDTVEPFLRELEALLVEAAYRDVPWPWRPPAGHRS
ncbi:condensation domain-containing protein [Solwaraspora sp. WMMD406]|uniref:condensation domain-containing protein n=1 Tax=Solwaraspora sp. WMMD406 TaxID=3016095 RepID=UPI0024168F71|nr:condensation domain-containing protein [Solwaraspora sp. WMMD406]MDG4764531.1 condensation domain-containing protein [Solwaraspora sp. WMMD406]